MALTTQQENGLVRAVALVGFYRNGDIVEPGQVLELPRHEFGLHRMYKQVDFAPAPSPAEDAATAPKAKRSK